MPRFLCLNQACYQQIYQAELAGAERGRSVTRQMTRWILQRLAIDKMSVAATAKALALGWDIVNELALDVCRSLIYDNPGHLDDVRVLGRMSTCGSASTEPEKKARLSPCSWTSPQSWMTPGRPGCWTWPPNIGRGIEYLVGRARAGLS